MPPKLHPEDRVIIEISSAEVYEGNIEYISPKCIELYNIFCQTTNSEIDGNMTFYRNEVVSVSKISDSPSSEASSSSSMDVLAPSKKINMDPDEFNRLKKMTFNFIFIDKFGKQFDDALEVLNNRESVAVVGLGSTFTRGKPLSLLLMADFKQVFIFDLFCLVQLRGLSDILQSSFICKIVHDGTALYDCLFHKYGVEMNNVFDVQIIDGMISQEENKEAKKCDISECLTRHFNFPPSLLSAAVDDIGDKSWQSRPLIKTEKIKAAQLVAYLPSLRDVLMEKIMSKYNFAIGQQYSKYKNMGDMELLMRRSQQTF